MDLDVLREAGVTPSPAASLMSTTSRCGSASGPRCFRPPDARAYGIGSTRSRKCELERLYTGPVSSSTPRGVLAQPLEGAADPGPSVKPA